MEQTPTNAGQGARYHVGFLLDEGRESNFGRDSRHAW
jgi:hypothetical protein